MLPLALFCFLLCDSPIWVLVTRVREARFYVHRFTNVRLRVSVGSGLGSGYILRLFLFERKLSLKYCHRIWPIFLLVRGI